MTFNKKQIEFEVETLDKKLKSKNLSEEMIKNLKTRRTMLKLKIRRIKGTLK